MACLIESGLLVKTHVLFDPASLNRKLMQQYNTKCKSRLQILSYVIIRSLN